MATGLNIGFVRKICQWYSSLMSQDLSASLVKGIEWYEGVPRLLDVAHCKSLRNKYSSCRYRNTASNTFRDGFSTVASMQLSVSLDV